MNLTMTNTIVKIIRVLDKPLKVIDPVIHLEGGKPLSGLLKSVG
jgi:hypothetical protein